MNALAQLAIEEAPAIISWLRDMFKQQHPDEPEPTSEEVIAAYESAFASSIAKDAAWLSAHGDDV